MAKVSNPLIGISRGRVGGVVMYRRKGENIIREHVAQIDDKNTGQQSANRGAFLLCILALSLVKGTIASFFTPSQANQTPWSDCVGFNALNAITNDVTEKYDSYGLPYFDRIFSPFNLKYADLSQAPLGDFTVTNAFAGAVAISWDKTLLGIGGLTTDEVDFILINTTLKQVVGLSTPWGLTRNTEAATINYPPTWEDSNSLVIAMVRPVNHSLQAMQATLGGADLANILK